MDPMRRWARRILSLAAAPADERKAVWAAVALSPRVGRRLRRRGYAATRDWLAARPAPAVSAEAAVRADRALRLLPWQPRCLERSLLVWWLAGDGAEIHLGVSPEGRRFHAWVERDGTVLNDHPDVATRYLPFRGTDVDTDRFDQ